MPLDNCLLRYTYILTQDQINMLLPRVVRGLFRGGVAKSRMGRLKVPELVTKAAPDCSLCNPLASPLCFAFTMFGMLEDGNSDIQQTPESAW